MKLWASFFLGGALAAANVDDCFVCEYAGVADSEEKALLMLRIGLKFYISPISRLNNEVRFEKSSCNFEIRNSYCNNPSIVAPKRKPRQMAPQLKIAQQSSALVFLVLLRQQQLFLMLPLLMETLKFTLLTRITRTPQKQLTQPQQIVSLNFFFTKLGILNVGFMEWSDLMEAVP